MEETILLISAFVFLQLVDIMLTRRGLSLGLTEKNPLIKRIGYKGKLIVTAFLVAVCFVASCSSSETAQTGAFYSLIAINILMIVVVTNNLVWVFKATKNRITGGK